MTKEPKKIKVEPLTPQQETIYDKMVEYATKGDCLELVLEQYECYRDYYKFERAVYMALSDYDCERVGEE